VDEVDEETDEEERLLTGAGGLDLAGGLTTPLLQGEALEDQSVLEKVGTEMV
jgi:hypothetical protein